MLEGRFKRGAVLIMSMMAIVLAFMLLSTLIQTTGVSLNNTSAFYDSEAALQAAQSGVDYAVTKLRGNMDWCGDDNALVGSLAAGVAVKEDYGNVVGLIKNSANHVSAFRIKFNYEIKNVDFDTARRIEKNLFFKDGSLNSSALPIDMPYVSLNNFGNSDDVLMYRANNNGKGVCKDNKILNLELFTPKCIGIDEDNSFYRSYSNHVPPYTTCLIVEGMAGKGLRDCKNPEDINDDKLFHGEAVTRRYVEVYLNQNFNAFKGYAAYAKGNINITVRDKAFVHSGGDLYSKQGTVDDRSTLPKPGYMRSDKKFDITKPGGGKGVLNAFNGVVFSEGPPSFAEDTSTYTFLNSAGNERSYSFSTVGQSKHGLKSLDELKYEDVPHTDAGDQSEDICILPGLYEWHKSAENANYYELRYYGEQYSVDKDTHDPKPKVGASYKIAAPRGVLTAEQLASGKYVEVAPAGKFEFITEVSETSSGGGTGTGTADPGSGSPKPDITKITEPTLFLKGKLSCNGSLLVSSCKDISDTAGFVDKCPQVIFDDYSVYDENGEIDEEQSENGVLTAKDDILFIASLKGSGAAITDGGDVYFVGKSVVESGNDGVAIYGKNVNLESMDMIVSNISGKALSAKMQGFKGVVSGDNVYFRPDANTMFDILKNNDTDKLVSYIEKNYGITVSSPNGVSDKSSGHGRHKVEQFEITVSAGGRDYLIVSSKTRHGKNMDIYKLGYGWIWPVYDMEFPLSAVNDGLGDEVNQMIKKLGELAYGDQRISGAIYAKNDFNVNLNGKYKLFVQGAVHARENINANCSAIDLDYDEMYVSKLLDTNGMLNRSLWNCW